MDIVNLFLFGLISLVIGAIVMLLVQYYVYTKFCELPEQTEDDLKFINEKYSLPDNIRLSATTTEPDSTRLPLVAVNLIMQFLFHELKNSNRVRKWCYRKLSIELDELISKTTIGRLFDKLTITELCLGEQFPEVKALRVHNAELQDDEGWIENLDLLLEINYKGNFRTSIEADMVLGKKGSLTLKVQKLTGLARLQFTRNPYTHWSLSFLGDPQLELGIESQFQGRQMQSNITSLISNQIRKAVRRKHTLPNYKLRYKPFFHKIEEEFDTTDVRLTGDLEVKISEITRVMKPPVGITDIFCTLTVASQHWVEAKQKDDRNVLATLDVEIHKAKNQQIGIVFKQCETFVQVEAILPNTPAIKANIKPGDVLISIEGKPASTIQQVAKILKSFSNPNFTLRFERTIPGVIRNDAIMDDVDIYDDITEEIPTHLCFTKSTKYRRNSATSSESSVANTPSQSPRKTKIIAKVFNKVTSSNKDNTTELPPFEASPQSPPTYDEDKSIEYFPQHSTIYCVASPYIVMDDLCKFKLGPKTKYLNICIYGKGSGQCPLLGYLSISILNILGEHTETHLKSLIKMFSISPPTKPDMPTHPLSSLSGFDAKLCFGDVLLSFKWIEEEVEKKKKKKKGRVDKSEEANEREIPKTHKFIRTHFNRSTQCEFCGKKIWLKDAVQCSDCGMCCHKKCINKCQVATVCVTDLNSITSGTSQPEVTLTEPPPNSDDADTDELDDLKNKADATSSGHRQSLSGFLAEGLKRVNSANNLAIPGIVSQFSQNSKSLPPSPQHTPRKQSLVNANIDPFMTVTQRLESIPNDLKEFSPEQIVGITEALVNWPQGEDIMNMAKNASKKLYSDLDGCERVDKINKLLTKLRIALDSETANHSALMSSASPTKPDKRLQTPEETLRSPISTKGSIPNDKADHEMMRRSLLLAQSDARVQALSVIMLYLCTGLQHAQGVAFL